MQRIEPDPDLVNSIESAISMSGLLFQAHPAHPEWDTTRPGARPGEVAAFKHDVDGERPSYISVVFHAEGETEMGSDYVFESDCYELVYSHGDGSQGRDIAPSAQRAAELVATEMQQIAQQ